MIPGVDIALCRKPEILSDAAYLILTGPSTTTGNFYIDDEVLLGRGVDLTQYSSAPEADLQIDIFVEPRYDELFTLVQAELRRSGFEDLIAAGSRIAGAASASFFIGRNNYAFSATSGMPIWQDVLFITLHRNAADPTDYFNIPPGRVIVLDVGGLG